jgi:hypothetical protein
MYTSIRLSAVPVYGNGIVVYMARKPSTDSKRHLWHTRLGDGANTAAETRRTELGLTRSAFLAAAVDAYLTNGQPDPAPRRTPRRTAETPERTAAPAELAEETARAERAVGCRHPLNLRIGNYCGACRKTVPKR